MLPIRIPVAVFLLALAANAAPRTWTFSGVALGDGGTITGSFIFDPNAGVPCSTGASPCGVYSSVNVTTTTGSARTGATYTAVCGATVPSCNGLNPDSTGVLFLTASAANQTGLPALAVFFTGLGGVPPAGLTNAGGSVNIGGGVGAGIVQEAACSNAACTGPTAPVRFSTAGFVIGTLTTVPTLSDWGQAVLGIALAAATMLRIRRATA
jgi:hypothetical protein